MLRRRCPGWYGGVWVPASDQKYMGQFRYYEVARHDPKTNKIFRQKADGESTLLDPSEVERYRHAHGNLGVYTSVQAYRCADINRSTSCGSLYFDLDSNDLAGAQADAITLVDYLSTAIPESGLRVYFSGKKGFHVEAEAIALGISPADDLPRLFRYIANELRVLLDLSTLDFAVYDRRRMWRLPNSEHPSTGYYKVELGRRGLSASLDKIYTFAQVPHFEIVVPEQHFDGDANRWFREWGYRQLERSETFAQRIARFERQGTGRQRNMDSDMVFDLEGLRVGCPAVLRLEEKAKIEHNLEHEERLFLCSLLSYSDAAVDHLHGILAECDDYDPARSQAHIDDWVRRREQGIGGRPYTCVRANSVGVGCGSCELPWRNGAQPSPLRYAYTWHKKE